MTLAKYLQTHLSLTILSGFIHPLLTSATCLRVNQDIVLREVTLLIKSHFAAWNSASVRLLRIVDAQVRVKLAQTREDLQADVFMIFGEQGSR